MFRLAIILCLCTSLPAQSPSEWWADSDSSQKASVRGSYDRNKQYDRGWTLAAFNPIESAGGRYLVRLGEDVGGEYSQNAYNVAKRENKQKRLQVPFDTLWIFPYKRSDNPTNWQVSRAMQNLILDRGYDDRHGRAHLDELLRQYGGDWMKVWQGWNSQKENQDKLVRAWVRFLKTKFK